MKRGNVPKFKRERSQRLAFLKGLATALITHGKITTTTIRAKAVRTTVEKMITKAKGQSVTARRMLSGQLGTAAVKKLVDDIGPRFKERQGGYTRIIPLGRRMSDGSSMSSIEFV